MNLTKEQLDAINFDNTSIIVSAGAGSGKTAVLTKRVIRKIKDGSNINELLILTFTNKAANEMKERIRKALKEQQEFKNQLNLLNEAYITTFDSFALSILKKYHYILNLSKNIIIADASLIYLKKQEIIDDIFESMYKEENPYFIELIDKFCIKDDADIKKYILNIFDNINLLIDKNNYLNNYLNNFYNQENINNLIKKFQDLIRIKQDTIINFLEEISTIDYEYYTKIKDCLNQFIESYTYDEIVKNINFKLPNLPKDSDDDLKNIKNNISETIKDIKCMCEYDNINDIKESLLSTENYVKIIIQILQALDKRLLEYKKQNNIYEFNDISLMLINLLKNNENIRLELKNSYKEIMIDEYQDTSDIQEELISLISNNNVYMVGDIKQSIYRFRNANPHIFKNKYEQYSKNINGIKIDLTKNFRSREEVLNNINLLFNQLMDSTIGGADYSNGQQMIYGNLKYELKNNSQNYNMDILNYNYDKEKGFSKEEIEIFIIANDIINKVNNKFKVIDKDTGILRNCTFNDFAILVDRATNFELFKKIFEFMKIPLTIFKDERLNNGIEIIVIKNIIKILFKIKNNELDTEFRYLFTSIARSFIFEYDDNEIFKCFSEDNFINNEIYYKCHKLSKFLSTYTNSMLIDKILEEFKFLEKIIKLGDVQNRIIRLDYLNNFAINIDSLGYTIKDFSDYLEQLTTNNYDIKYSLSKESPNGVQIMTIHASKGLEFSICYFPLLYKTFNVKDLTEKFLFDNEYGIITPYFKEGIGKTILKYLLKNKYMEEEISEKIRLFYVALTRVKEKMIIVADTNQPQNIFEKRNFRSFLDMLMYINDEIKSYKKDINYDDIIMSHDYNLNNNSIKLDNFETNTTKIIINELKFDNKLEDKNTFSKSCFHFIDEEEEQNLQIGTYLHYLLENIDFKKPNIESYNLNPFYKDKLNKFFKLEILKNLKDANIYKEYEFIQIENNVKKHGIIDLILEYEDHIDIIDYKFQNIDDEQYNAQLKGYKNFIENKTNKKVNTYLYSILNEKLKYID